MYKDNFAVITGTMELQANTQEDFERGYEKQTILKIDFPAGFNKDNCVCTAFGMKSYEEKNYTYGIGGSSVNRMVSGSYYRHAVLGAPGTDTSSNTKIALEVWQPGTTVITVYYKLVLMKI